MSTHDGTQPGTARSVSHACMAPPPPGRCGQKRRDLQVMLEEFERRPPAALDGQAPGRSPRRGAPCRHESPGVSAGAPGAVRAGRAAGTRSPVAAGQEVLGDLSAAEHRSPARNPRRGAPGGGGSPDGGVRRSLAELGGAETARGREQPVDAMRLEHAQRVPLASGGIRVTEARNSPRRRPPPTPRARSAKRGWRCRARRGRWCRCGWSLAHRPGCSAVAQSRATGTHWRVSGRCPARWM